MAAQTAVKQNRTQPGNHVSTSGMHVLSQNIIDPADGAELLSMMGSRQDQDLANDCLQMAAAQEARAARIHGEASVASSRSSSVVPMRVPDFQSGRAKDALPSQPALFPPLAARHRLRVRRSRVPPSK